MGINWRNVINNHVRGMDLASAYYVEDQRQHEASRREDEKRRTQMRKARGSNVPYRTDIR